MNILMMTNTFTPHIGGVARSVERFTAEFRRHGHRVLVVAPVFENMPNREENVVRVPALQHFNGSDFSVVLPISGLLGAAIKTFQPEIVHSHHPFLLGSTALRIAHVYDLPLVFTHHTLYEQYTHYVPGNSQKMKEFVVNLATEYANCCDRVVAPSDSIRTVLIERGVTTPVDVVPTGVQTELFQQGSGPGMRAVLNIPQEAFVVGHLGRLAPEKNLSLLSEAVAMFLKKVPRAHFLLVGTGPSCQAIRAIFDRQGLGTRFHHIGGALEQSMLVSAYKAMDVFAFTSKSETQGMVVTEAMAAGLPVIALDASGVREVVQDQVNGRLLFTEASAEFADALQWVATLSGEALLHLGREASKTAATFSMEKCGEKILGLYDRLIRENNVQPDRRTEWGQLETLLRVIRSEWDIVKNIAGAAGGTSHLP